MSTITTETTVGEIVRATPGASRIFEHLGVDYCCGGKKTLAEACRTKQLEPATVIAMLSAFQRMPNDPPLTSADAMGLAELCDHIVRAHHNYLRDELPRLDYMTRKVAAVHGGNEPRLLVVRHVFEHFAAELSAHMQKEESEVFPCIRALETALGSRKEAGAALQRELAKLEMEHDQAGAALAELKSLTNDYTPPEWACNTFRALYDALAHLEKNMHQHVHKENNVLFPRALAAAC
jgi:regulator of cell morphogenesis and NO signaling